MPAISKIRFTNVVYEEGLKRYNDECFYFDGYNGAVVLENGGGKTVFLHTMLQAVLPHASLGDRKMKETLQLDGAPAHIAVEWLLSESAPRRYVVTAVSLYQGNNELDSLRYVYEYSEGDKHDIHGLPFVHKDSRRPSDRGEIADYYQGMAREQMNAHTFQTIREYKRHLEDHYQIIAKEWESIAKINGGEGDVEQFFAECRQTNQLFDRLLIPVVEDAMAGFERNTFADTFEEHRDNFRAYKELRERIEENRMIENELESYVQVFEALHEEEQSYARAKGYAKAVAELTAARRSDKARELRANESRWQEWQEQQHDLERRQDALAVRKLEQTKQQRCGEWEEADLSYRQAAEALAQAKRRYFSYKLAEAKVSFQQQEERETYYKAKIDSLDEQADMQDLKERAQQNSSEFRGYFQQEEERLDRLVQELDTQCRPLEEELERLEERMNGIQAAIHEEEKQYHTKEGSIQGSKAEQQRIQSRILADPEQESVAARLKEWEQQYRETDEKRNALITSSRRLKEENESADAERRHVQETLETARARHVELDTRKKTFDTEHDRMLASLQQLRYQWRSITSVYYSESQIREQFAEQIDKRHRNREDALLRERAARRFTDDYSEQDHFFADAYLASRLEAWNAQFDLLETGTSYLQTLPDETKEQAQHYLFWPVTLITTKRDKSAVYDKLASVKKQLQFPVFLFTQEEAKAAAEGGETGTTGIVPDHWRTNLGTASFQAWKDDIEKQADAATEVRRQQEEELRHWQYAQQDLEQFLANYSYENRRGIEEELSEQTEVLEESGRRHESLTKQIEEQTRQIELEQNESTELLGTLQGLEQTIQEALRHDALEKEMEKEQNAQQKLAASLAERRVEQERVQHDISRWREDLQEHRDEQKEYRQSRSRLRDDPRYKETADAGPVFTGKSRALLEQEYEDIRMQQHNISQSRGEWEAERRSAEEQKEAAGRQIQELRLEHDDLDEHAEPPLFTSEEQDRLFQTYRTKETEEQAARSRMDKVRETWVKADQSYQDAWREFQQRFHDREPDSFDTPLEEAARKLEEEKEQVTSRKAFLAQEQSRIEARLQALDEASRELEKFQEAHHFQGPSVEAAVLSEKETERLEHDQRRIIQETIDALKRTDTSVQKKKKDLQQAASAFIQFCRDHVQDVKLQQKAIKGIEQKQSYEEVLQFRRNMKQALEHAIRINEETIRTYDKQFEQFIAQMHTHLSAVKQELEMIPKKTRVKTGEDWKQIYTFTIPDWEEDEGRARLRRHVEWIIEQLEAERYQTADGGPDTTRMRKDIETWLQSKQLLQQVFNGQPMKVTCRKVTNDTRVTTSRYSWEQSNNWSGGERWSKNMTLFLGILNYIAEKQKHIEPHMKRHRSVILDNPFGAASNDHVLHPVFFIAEQLGFQIIALTAHAEGKFLRDFFPVIYSCRLQPAVDPAKQIITKEKHLHQAYFQDHDPQALQRLGEVEQLSLFE
ncbi:hypothetical protein [Salibacterium qingdaonense]|uniref:Chromosome segregation ATPase n=1 Tax=Salibacterium qingdaonense TaxID=266892 RepID=A0A1I4N3H3_9BACI|nr:hypothetical protein [Salibacterium qingdaonense]SFM10124.1 hypothetical protein SAMN04488054_11517 [Salibacterium qingdaonense]